MEIIKFLGLMLCVACLLHDVGVFYRNSCRGEWSTLNLLGMIGETLLGGWLALDLLGTWG